MNIDITIDDVLYEWFRTLKDDKYTLAKDPARIVCKRCDIIWMRVWNNKFEYALEPDGKIYYIELGDPQLFEKLDTVIKSTRHGHRYGC